MVKEYMSCWKSKSKKFAYPTPTALEDGIFSSNYQKKAKSRAAKLITCGNNNLRTSWVNQLLGINCQLSSFKVKSHNLQS